MSLNSGGNILSDSALEMLYLMWMSENFLPGMGFKWDVIEKLNQLKLPTCFMKLLRVRRC